MEKDTLGIINSRRSTRKWTGAAVTESDLLEILEAAMNAPSAGDERAWQFVILTDKKIMEEYSTLNQNVGYLKNAPAAILVCGDTSLEKYAGYHSQDCAAATQNILLAVHAKGLGAVWGAVFPSNISVIKTMLNLPENVIPFSVIPIGYPDAKAAEPMSRFDESRIHKNNW